MASKTPRDEAAFQAALDIARSLYGYPIEHSLDAYFAWDQYFNGSLGDADRMLDAVQVGKVSPNELKKFQTELTFLI